MNDAVVWTLVFIGGDLLVLLALLMFAVSKDRRKLQERT